MTLSPGSRLGPYEILAPIGAGGMGEVYRARDTRLQREVALKVLPPALVADPARRARFVREAQAASALEHPHIAVIHEIADADRITFIVMELIRGEPLSDIIARGPLTPSRALGLTIEVAEGLARAHDTGIAHRDLKPANIMVTAEGHAKIIDFGLAKLVNALSADSDAPTALGDVTEPGVVVGTAAYMSPEQVRGEVVDHRTDVFSLGVVMYEMVAGRRPFRGRSGIETMHAVLNDPVPPLPERVSAATGDLPRIVGKCLAKDPAGRYQRMHDVVVDLRAAQRLLESGQVRRSGIARRLVPFAMAGMALVLAIGAAVGWTSARRARDEAARTAAIADVERLVDGARLVDAWRVARAGLGRWPGDPRLESALRAATDTVTIATDPPGAEVMLKAYTDVAGEWIRLGTSPLEAVRAPLGMLRWRISKEGFEPIEARLEVGTPAAAAGRPDFEARPIRLRRAGEGPAGAVFVPAGRARGKDLGDYWIDRTEVSNRDFKQFIDRGGYQDPSFWGALEQSSPSLFRRLGSIAEFTDRTGQPGPSTWELGAYPEGQGDHPVSGVSWYEAAAYCASVQRTLPSVFHWRFAFGAFFFSEVVTLGNFGGRGPEPVGTLEDLGPHGTLGMAGNVKEWARNAVADKRYILGGGWNEPPYMATNDDARPPLDRAETNGVRCMKESMPSDASVFAPLALARAASAPREPLTDREFAAIRRFYAYDRLPLEARVERAEEHEHWRRERVSFAAAYGDERVIANILLPKNVRPPYQAVVWFPGSYALELRSTEGDLPFSMYFDFIARSGRALVYPVYSGTYERRVSRPTRAPGTPPTLNEWRDEVVRWSKDFGRTVDYLESRGDIDGGRVAYYGYSMGAMDAVPILGVEDRIRAAILLTGGLTDDSSPPEIDPARLAPRVTLPILMLGGELDFGLPVESSQKPLFNLFGTPPDRKRLVIFKNAGHVPPRIELIREVLDWLDQQLGPVR